MASLRLPAQLIWDGDVIGKWIAVSSAQDVRLAIEQMQGNDIARLNVRRRLPKRLLVLL